MSLFDGAIALCEFGVTAHGSACPGATPDDRSDVLIVTNLGDGTTCLDFLSDSAGP